jgi:hypothetical protein
MTTMLRCPEITSATVRLAISLLRESRRLREMRSAATSSLPLTDRMKVLGSTMRHFTNESICTLSFSDVMNAVDVRGVDA